MTKLLILSDSHSNRLALEHILKAEADHIDALIFLGDGLRDLEQTLTLYPRLRAYPVAEQRGDVFLFNPGSCGRCYTGPNTYGILTLADGKVVGHEHKEVPKA